MRLTLLLATLLLAPLAAAHVSDYAQTRTVVAGPYNVFFEPRPIPPFANTTVSLVAQFSDVNTGTLLRSVPATVIVGGPNEFNARKNMEPDGTGYLFAAMVLPVRGNYSARILVHDDKSGENYSADVEFEVFPDIPYRFRPVDQNIDVYTGQVTPMAFEVLDPATLGPKDTLPDLSVSVEHWSEDHSTFLGAEPYPATRVGSGTWRISPTFPEKGMYHMRFGSVAGGFNYADVPLLHIYAIDPATASGDGGDTPLPSVSLVGAAVVGVALLLRRR